MERFVFWKTIPRELGRGGGYLVEPHILDEHDEVKVERLANKYETLAHFDYDVTGEIGPTVKSDLYLFENLRKTMDFRYELLEDSRLVLCIKVMKNEMGLFLPQNFSPTEKKLILSYDSKIGKIEGSRF